jgi:hypothetical protein
MGVMMPRVIPSDVVTLINDRFPNAADDINVHSGHAGTLSAIVQLVAQIPDELLTISGGDYGDFISSIESLKYTLDRWPARGGDDPPPKVKGKSPVINIRNLLKKCPDQQPSPATATLTFIGDPDYRESVRNDISTAYSSLHNCEWKPATVLAGAVVEALLLWAIERRGK